MKTKNIFLYGLIISSLTFAGCGSKKEESTHEGHAMEEPAADTVSSASVSGPQFEVDEAFQKQLSDVFTSYVSLKDAFVSSDASKVKNAATKTAASLAGTDMKLLSGAAHNDWMTYSAGMSEALKKIETASDIEVQRKSFSELSDNLYKSAKAYGLGGTTAYYEFCPMAFNNQGGFWLSDAEEIRNPYFGDKMLTCGSVQEKIQ